MGTRGYYLPPNHEQFADCDGFYVDNSVLYTSGDEEKDWAMLTEQFCRTMMKACPELALFNAWKPCELGQSRYVLVQNQYVDIMLETEDGYTAIFAIIPENCRYVSAAKQKFKLYVHILKQVLTELYPGHIRKRKNAWECLLVG